MAQIQSGKKANRHDNSVEMQTPMSSHSSNFKDDWAACGRQIFALVFSAV